MRQKSMCQVIQRRTKSRTVTLISMWPEFVLHAYTDTIPPPVYPPERDRLGMLVGQFKVKPDRRGELRLVVK